VNDGVNLDSVKREKRGASRRPCLLFTAPEGAAAHTLGTPGLADSRDKGHSFKQLRSLSEQNNPVADGAIEILGTVNRSRVRCSHEVCY
jgi:hypothetical protein